jgi:hypothetical protein
MKALYGSIAVLLEASSSQRNEGHPQREHEWPEEQADRTADRTEQEVRFSSAQSVTPRPVAHRADERLDQEACDRSRQVQQRQLRGVGAEELVDRVYRRLLQAEAVLDAKEPEVHKQYGPEAQRRFALEILALDLGRWSFLCNDRHGKASRLRVGVVRYGRFGTNVFEDDTPPATLPPRPFPVGPLPLLQPLTKSD